jgi:hypothetical protein
LLGKGDEVKIIIHGGMDKCGSTAIQAHFKMYRGWLLERGIYLPLSGLTGFGHIHLFKDLNSPVWDELHDELSGDEARHASCVFLSWEGIGLYSPERIDQLRNKLEHHEVSLLFYIRDQVEAIQSGYLQNLKTGRQKITLRGFEHNQRLLTPMWRDYLQTANHFEAVFGREAISFRLFERRLFPEGNVVFDALLALGVPPGDRFIASAHNQNISLDVTSAQILNLFDSVSGDEHARKLLVNELLWYIERHDSKGGRFFSPAAVRTIVNHDASSNAELMARYNIDSGGGTLFPGSLNKGHRVDGLDMLDELTAKLTYPLWEGETLEGEALALVTDSAPGWSDANVDGVWSIGEQSRFDFKLPSPMGYPPSRPLRLTFKGVYFSGNETTEIWCGGKFLGNRDLRRYSFEIPLDYLEDDREVHLLLRHASPQSSADLDESEDQRLLAFQILSLGYEWL